MRHGEAGVVPVAVLPLRGQHQAHRRFGKPANADQGINYLVPFGGQLCWVVQMLPLASGAVAEVLAGRRHPVGRGFQHLDHTGGQVVAVQSHHLGHHPLAGNAAEDKHVPALIMGHGFAQPAPRGQIQGQLLAPGNMFLSHLHN